MRRPRCILLLVTLLFAAAVCLPAAADPISKFIDPDLFGHLNQHKTKCMNFGCGGTAVLNSLVFLQNFYPFVYQGQLTGPDQAAQIATVNQIEDDMGSTPNKDTPWGSFVSGKEKYINSHAPGTTSYSDESIYDGGDPVAPTPTYIVDQLMHNQDVEILVEGRNADGTHFGHYVTVTGMSYDPSTNAGMFTFVDPWDSDVKTRDFIVGDDGFIDFTAANGLARSISGAVSEGPTGTATPEPSSAALAIEGGVATFLILFRRRRH